MTFMTRVRVQVALVVVAAALSCTGITGGCLPGAFAAQDTADAAAKMQSAAESKADEKVADIDWQPDFDKALLEAKEQNKFVLVDVFTDWCVYCKKLDREVYTDAAVSKYLNDRFICVRANAEDNGQGEDFSNKFDAHAYPTILVFDSQSKKEKPVARISGYLPPKEFNTAIHSIAESKKYKQGKHRKS
jgi:thiol:disulfide interchange protein